MGMSAPSSRQPGMIGKITLYLLLILSLAIISLLVHEMAHGLTTVGLGGRLESLYVYPGIQVWPNLGERFPFEWGNLMGMARLAYPPEWDSYAWQVGLIALMGSGANFILGSLALIGLWIFHPKGWLRKLLLLEALVFWDLPFYAFFPLLGWRHFIFFGGYTPEPLDGLRILGFPDWISLELIFIACFLWLVGYLLYLRRPVRK